MAERPTVYVEVTTTLAARFTAGYERLVRSILAALGDGDSHGLDVVPVVAKGRTGHRRLTETERQVLAEHPAGGTTRRRADRFGPLSPMVRAAVGLPAVGRARATVANTRRRMLTSPAIRALDVGIPPMGAIWLDLEPAWNDPEPRSELLARMGAEGLHTAVMVADVMPELHPEWFDPHQRRAFGDWLQAHLLHSGLFLCISQNTADDLRRVAEVRGIARELPIEVVPLGADLPEAEPEPMNMPPEIGRYMLVVGTLEPRKNQGLVLQAFEQLRRRHDDLGLVLVGRQGWMVDDLAESIREHPDFGERLLWPDGVTDAQLAWLYENAFLTIAPSRYEGLGVPVMEALSHGSPTMASTGGALVEAGAGLTEAISPDDLDALVVAIERHLMDDDHHHELVLAARRYEMPRWSATADAVAAALARLGTTHPPLPGRLPRRAGTADATAGDAQSRSGNGTPEGGGDKAAHDGTGQESS